MTKKYHFIAIGGSIMHSLAIQLKELGHEVTGSDDVIFGKSAENLKKANLLPPEAGWHTHKISPFLDGVILGMHAKADNPELLKAKELGIPIYSFPEFVYELSKEKTRVVIGGSHGKTSITSMILHVLNDHHIAADYLVGAAVKGLKNQVKLSNAEIIVIEGDEYLTSPIDRVPKFFKYHHHIGVISGIEWDHANVFPTEENYIDQFSIFAKMTPENGKLIYNSEDPKVAEIGDQLEKEKKIPYRTLPYQIRDEQCFLNNNIPMKIFGKHNYSNLSAALQVCLQLGLNEDEFYQSIASFEGAGKRLQRLPSAISVVYLDFAHAPSKVTATVEAVRELHPNKELVAVFELHTFSSISKSFVGRYRHSLSPANIAAIYFNPENKSLPKEELVDQDDIINGFRFPGLHLFRTPETLSAFISQHLKPNHVLLLMSSGQFGGINIETIVSGNL